MHAARCSGAVHAAHVASSAPSCVLFVAGPSRLHRCASSAVRGTGPAHVTSKHASPSSGNENERRSAVTNLPHLVSIPVAHPRCAARVRCGTDRRHCGRIARSTHRARSDVVQAAGLSVSPGKPRDPHPDPESVSGAGAFLPRGLVDGWVSWGRLAGVPGETWGAAPGAGPPDCPSRQRPAPKAKIAQEATIGLLLKNAFSGQSDIIDV